MSKSNFLENALLNHVLGSEDYTPPATLYVGLHTSNPGEDNSGAEVSGVNYARVASTNNTTNWPTTATSVKSNGVDIDFPTPGAGGWGLVTHFGVYDAASGGNLLYYSNLTVSKTIDESDAVSFPAGSLTFTED